MSDMRSMTEDVGARVAERLAQLQDDRTDAEMARLVGCGRVHWSQIKHGHKRISYELVKQAGKTFPEILEIVVDDLRVEVA